MDELEKFLLEVFENSSFLGQIPLFNAVHTIEGVTSVIWYREPPFQVQLFIAPPNYIVPEHTHPNVDSFEIYLGGQIRFSHSGKFTAPEASFTIPAFDGTALSRGNSIRVRPNDVHGGIVGPSGGVFMSVQHWLNGVEPHCVAADYTGVTMGSDHFSKVKAGNPELKAVLTKKDAANLEF
jgi:quercetin dioxygenase-like cupin family protein